jgi:hypothetical protein
MARSADEGTWFLTRQEAQLFDELKGKLRVIVRDNDLKSVTVRLLPATDRELATELGIDASTFCQAQRYKEPGKNRKGFRVGLKEKLKDMFDNTIRVSADRAGSNEKNILHLKSLSDALFGGADTTQVETYYRPGGHLPLDAMNYVARMADRNVGHLAQASAYAIAVVGGPRTGKSSFLRRLVHRAEQLDRRVRFVDLGAHWRGVLKDRPTKHLTLGDIVSPIVSTLTAGEVTSFSVREEERGVVALTLVNRLSEYFARRDLNNTLVVLDGFNEAVDLGALPSDVLMILGALFGLGHLRTRALGLTIAVADEGIAAASDAVSEMLTRSNPVFTGRLSVDDVRELAAKVLGESESDFDHHRLLDFCGSNMHVAHLVLEQMKVSAKDRHPQRHGKSEQILQSLDKAIADLTQMILSGRTEEGAGGDVERDLARLCRRTERLLLSVCSMVATADSHGSNGAIEGFLKTIANQEATLDELSRHFYARRTLDWTGLIPEGTRPPRYLVALARKMLASSKKASK